MVTKQSEGSRSLLAFCEEPDGWGILPVPSRNWTGFRFTRESIGRDINAFESQEIRSDRMVSASLRGNQRAEGDVNFELGPSSHNLWLKHLFSNLWAGGAGTTAPYTYTITGGNNLETGDGGLSFVKGFADIPYYLAYTGGRVDSTSFEIPQEGLVTCTGRILFENESAGAASPQFNEPLDYPAEDPYESNLTQISVVAYDAAATLPASYSWGTPIAVATSGRFSISNTADGSSYVLNSNERFSIPLGRRRIEGSMNLLFVDDSEYIRYVNGTALAMRVTFTNGLVGANERFHQFVFPNIRYSGPSATPRVDGESGIRYDIPFRALRHPGFGTDVYLTAKIGETIQSY